MSKAPLPAAAGGDLYEDAPCGLLVLDGDWLVVRANATAARWLGYGGDELPGKLRFTDLLTAGGRIFAQTHLSPLMRMQGSVAEVKLQFRHKDGHAIPMMLNMAERAVGREVQVHVALFVAEDRHRYERELVAQRKRAQELAGFAEQMMGIVSHDLRNPLNVISMSTFLLKRMAADAAEQKVLARITKSTSHAERLIDDLLDFTQMRLGKGLSIRVRDIRLNDVVADAVAALQVAHGADRIVHVRSGEAACEADADRVSQVVGNLVGNALTYGDMGRPVTVSSTAEGGTFEVSVHNEGPAIPAEVQAQLFEPMVRGGDHGGRGVGLGLYIVREIARAHGGEVRVHSAPEQGTTFTVRFGKPLQGH